MAPGDGCPSTARRLLRFLMCRIMLVSSDERRFTCPIVMVAKDGTSVCTWSSPAPCMVAPRDGV